MPLFVQDAIVTAVSGAALLTLVWRTVGLLRSSRPSCGSCSTCAPAPTEPRVIAIDSLKSRSRVSRQT